jgi:hypothetical protein
MAVTLTSISPTAGPPGTAITLTGSGFTTGSLVGAPTLVPATYVSATELLAEVPAVSGPAGGSAAVGVFRDGGGPQFVRGAVVHGGVPCEPAATWTTVDAVAGEVPGFQRGGQISDAQIGIWARTVAQAIAGAMLRRGLSMNPADWQQPDTGADPSPADVLEMINRLGAAARLAAAIAGQFSQGEWGLAKNLERSYQTEMKALKDGDYDKLFRAASATLETGPQFSSGDVTDDSGNAENAFTKQQRF